MNQKRKYKVGDLVMLTDEAFDTIGTLTRKGARQALDPIRIERAEDVYVDDYPLHQMIGIKIDGVLLCLSSEDVLDATNVPLPLKK